MHNTQPSIWDELKSQFINPRVVTADLRGKTVVVLGASRGLGFEAAKHFATMQPERLILLCRSQPLGDEAIAKIKADTGYGESEVRLIDLQSISSVRSFADDFRREGGRLDIFVANAATSALLNSTLTPDGWELAYQTNNFSTHLLCLLLLPCLIETSQKYNTTPRLVIVSSGVHYFSDLNKQSKFFDAENPTHAFGKYLPQNKAEVDGRYVDSKLLNVLFTRGLASRLKKQRIVVNAVNPGYCISYLRRSWTGFQKAFDVMTEILFARSTEQGSRQLIFASVSGAEDAMNGAYVSSNDIWAPSIFTLSNDAKDVAFKERLWKTFMDEMVLAEPRVREIVDKYFD